MSKQRRQHSIKLQPYKTTHNKRSSSSHKNRILYTDEILETKGIIMNTTRQKYDPFLFTPDKVDLNKKKSQQLIEAPQSVKLNNNDCIEETQAVIDEYIIKPSKKDKIIPSITLKKASGLVNRNLIDSLVILGLMQKQQFISIYIKQKLRYQRALFENGIGENVQDGEFKLFIAKLTNY